MPESIVRRITWRSADIAAILTLVALFLLVWTFFWRVYTALFLGLISILLAMVIHAPARLLSRWIPFRAAFAFAILLLLGVLAGIVLTVLPQIAEQVSQLAGQLPNALQSVSDWIDQKAGPSDDSELLDGVNDQLSDFVGRFVPLAFNLISVVVGSFAVIILAIFLAAQPAVYRDLALRLIPPPHRERWARVYDEVGRNLRNWVLGKAFTMALVGVLTWIGLTLFGIPGALALAALAAVLEFIPNFGPTIAAAPAVIAAFAISPRMALYVAIFYFVLQQLQSAVTVPLVERRAVDIPPAALLIWQLMLAVGFGILGLFVATPLLAVIVVAVRILYLEPSEKRYSWDRRENEPAVHEPT